MNKIKKGKDGKYRIGRKIVVKSCLCFCGKNLWIYKTTGRIVNL